MTPAEVQLDLYANRPGGFGCGTERALYGIALSLRADLTEARTKLEIAELRVEELATTLVERDEQIAGLLANEVDLSDDQAGVPA
jgi:hypothetical protein